MLKRALIFMTLATLCSFNPAPLSLASDNDWKDEANARIEAIRKRDASILVVDEFGDPVPDSLVSVTQSRHHFAFGSTVGLRLVSDEIYSSFFLENFEWAVIENDSKWHANEPWRDFETYSRADATLDFLEEHGIPCAAIACSGPRNNSRRLGVGLCQKASCVKRSMNASTTPSIIFAGGTVTGISTTKC